MQLNKSLRYARFLILYLCLSCVSGCASWGGDVAQVFQIDEGNEPENQDKMVRFRTTYFFRVVDSCNIDDGIKTSSDSNPNDKNKDSYKIVLGAFLVRTQGKLKIVNDSLYRFRMTGKGSALYSTIHFESGVLREEQIDPFGSTVKYNQETKAFHVQSSSQIRERAQRDAILDEIKKLQTLNIQLGDTHQKEIDSLISAQLKLLAFENDSGLEREGSENQLCPDGHPITQNYFLYGPEGVRELDPDERLIMAMTVDSKPLIGMLQQLAGKQAQFQQSQPDSFRIVLAEQEKTTESLQEIDAIAAQFNSIGKLEPEDIDALFRSLKSSFGQ